MSHERPDYLDHRTLDGAAMEFEIMRSVRIGLFVKEFAKTLDPSVRSEFREIEQKFLRRMMEACGMERYPEVTGDPNGFRCSGEMICTVCSQTYCRHPMDWRVIGYGNVPFLNVLCDGRRVKL